MANPPRLPHGHWLGRQGARRDVAGFAVVRSAPTVPAREVARHVHPEAHVILVLAGPYLSDARGAAGPLAAGAALFNPAGTEHRDRFARLDGGLFLGISVDADRSRELSAAVRFSDGARLAPPEASRIALEIHGALDATGAPGALDLEALCLELFSALGQADDVARAPAWLPWVEELLHDRCCEPLRIGDLAGAAGVHPVHLARVFRRFLRTTPGAYLLRCRLERARALALRGAARLADVAAATGFHDQSHLTRAFRAAFGTTPGRLRAEVSSVQDGEPLQRADFPA